MPYESIAFHKKHHHHEHRQNHHHKHHWHGIHSLTAYVNQDGFIHHRNCGQAAAATALRYKRLFFELRLGGIEQNFPPDVAFGLFGTSKTQVCNILSALECRWHEIEGTDAIKNSIKHKRPVLVMLHLPTLLPSGHWMVAYAYDDHKICLTNYRSKGDHMSWENFEEGWDSWLPAMIDMDNTDIAID